MPFPRHFKWFSESEAQSVCMFVQSLDKIRLGVSAEVTTRSSHAGYSMAPKNFNQERGPI